jgi:hypothetical protein
MADQMWKGQSKVYLSLWKLMTWGMCFRETKSIVRGRYYHVHKAVSREKLSHKLEQCVDDRYERSLRISRQSIIVNVTAFKNDHGFLFNPLSIDSILMLIVNPGISLSSSSVIRSRSSSASERVESPFMHTCASAYTSGPDLLVLM